MRRAKWRSRSRLLAFPNRTRPAHRRTYRLAPGRGGCAWSQIEHPRAAAGGRAGSSPPVKKPDAGALIKMPAFRGRMSGAELADLTVYVLTLSQFGELPDPKGRAGPDVALRYGW